MLVRDLIVLVSLQGLIIIMFYLIIMLNNMSILKQKKMIHNVEEYNVISMFTFYSMR